MIAGQELESEVGLPFTRFPASLAVTQVNQNDLVSTSLLVLVTLVTSLVNVLKNGPL